MNSNSRDIYVLKESDDAITVGFGLRFMDQALPTCITHLKREFYKGAKAKLSPAHAISLCDAYTYTIENTMTSTPTLDYIPKAEHGNVLAEYWAMLLASEHQASNALDKIEVEGRFKLWNRVTGDNKKASWEK